MSKRTGAYLSLIRGVSEQVPHDRLPGQFWAQDNMISDPVRGLARRRGSELLDSSNSTAVLAPDTVADISNYKETSFSLKGREYSLAFRQEAKPSGSTAPALVCVDKDAGSLIPVFTAPSDPLLAQIFDGGITSVTTVGDFLLLASRSVAPTATTVDLVDVRGTDNIVWIKGGDYSRTYTVSCFDEDNVQVEVFYKTPESNYSGVLNTSDILTSDPDYQKKVNDRVHAYNTAVNQWIASAKNAIAPNQIAEQLRVLLVGAGVNATRVGAHLFIREQNIVTAEDGGNNEFIKAVSREVQSPADLSLYHVVGKVVKIVPKEDSFNNSAYYLQAKSKVPGLFGLQEVTWAEQAGVQITPNFVFAMGSVSGGALYVASDRVLLNSLLGVTNSPAFPASVAGDLDSQPVPQFFGSTISHIQTFQDRLMIVANATVFMSRPGDYFNFFRQTALSVLPDDPIEVYALGSEGDVITSAIQIDRGLLLFGDKHQYAIPAREAIGPSNAFIGIQGSYENAASCPPEVSGDKGFFAQPRESRLTIQQLQPGSYADNLQADDLTKQLDGYLFGTPRQLLAVTAPDMVFVRTPDLPNGIYVYSYLDATGQGRLFDSWSRWTWAEELGTLVSLSAHNSSVLAVYLRDTPDGVRLVLDRFSRETVLGTVPHLDSRRPVTEGGLFTSNASVAITAQGGEYEWLGTAYEDYAEFATQFAEQVPFMQLGTNFTASGTPTAPFIRDSQDRAILDGRLTLTNMKVTVSNSAAMRAFLSPARGGGAEQRVLDWIYRPAGQWIVNTQQVAETETLTVFVMKEVRDFLLRFESRTWLPLTISSIEWAGQFFTQRRR